MFSKQWEQFESDLKILEKWLSESESRLKYIKHQIRMDNELSLYIENIRSILRLESEAECNEELFEQVKSAVEQSITLNIFHGHGQTILNNINSQWNEVIQNITAIKEELFNKLNNVEYSEVAKQMNVWLTDVKDSYESHPIQNVNSLSDMQLLKHELWCWKKDVTVMESLCKFSSMPESHENENLFAEELQALKFKLVFHLERVQFFINKLMEFEENSAYLLHVFEIMQAHLIKINESNVKKNSYALLNNLDIIKICKNELKENEDKFTAIKQMLTVICEKTDNEDIKNNVVSKCNLLGQYYLSIHSIISSAEMTAENNLKLWNSYHENLDLCHHYLIEQEITMSLYDGSILNLDHLQKSILKLNDTFYDFMSNEKILDDVLQSSTLVKDCSDAGIQLEIESNCEILQNKWNSMKNIFCHLIETQKSLEIEWDAYSASFDSLLEWTSHMQNSAIGFHLNRSFNSRDYNKYLEELAHKKSSLKSLKEKRNHLHTYSDLHYLAKKSLETSFYSLSISMESLEKALIYCEEMNRFSHELERQKSIKDIETSLNSINMAMFNVVPSDRQELKDSISTTEEVLQDIAEYYANISCIKEHLILLGVFDFMSTNNLISNLVRIQKITSKLSEHYLKVVETSANNNTFLENCTLLLQLLKKMKNLHTIELPSDYWSLTTYFLKSQVMEIYIHSHDIVMLQVLNSKDLDSSFSSRFDAQHLHSSLCLYVKEWDSIETAYRNRMSLAMEKIHLWQEYLYHIYKIKSSFRLIRKEIAQECQISNIHLLKEELYRMSKIKPCLEKCLKEVDLVKNAAYVLLNSLKDPHEEESVQNQISDLRKQIEAEYQVLSARETELNELENTFNNLTSSLKTTHERLSSIQLYVTQGIPSSFEEMKMNLERAEIMKVTNEETLEILNSMDVTRLKCMQNNIEDQIATQKNLCQILNCELDQHISLIHKNLGKLQDFEGKYLYLIKWCEKMEQKINEFSRTPENAVNKLNIIHEEMTVMKLEFENTVCFGNSLLQNENMHNISDKISSLNSALSRIMHLHAKRLETLKKIIKCLEELSETSETLGNFLTTSEDTLELSLSLKDLPYEEIKHKLDCIQTLQSETAEFEKVSTKIQSLLNELDSCVVNFNSISLKNAMLYSQSILLRWSSFKDVIAKQNLSLQNMKSMWEEFLIALEKVENWLKCKEEIASKVNYSDCGHTRSKYLEGVGIFEKLNHAFQDDIQVLHSMNSSFHNINKREFNVSSSLRNRAMAANDQWHKLYKRVIEVFEALKNILQMWDDFDQLKEHLLMFLTEIDLKLTEVEATNLFQETSSESIEEDFKLHEDEKERFIATSKHLMLQSECSISIIEGSVDEVENYWKELYKRFRSLKNSNLQSCEKNTQLAALTIVIESDAKHEAPGEESDELNKKVSTVDEENATYNNINEKSEIHSESDQQQIAPQTYSEVVAMNSEKLEHKNQTEQVVTMLVAGSVAEKKSKIYPQERTFIHHSHAENKQTSFDDDCTKDLLAALKEAEERMDSLEKVLSELTPSGIDEQGPNYSRLLAACRSSVDVIQHLSQFLFYDVQCDSSKLENAEIKLQSEDVLQRWQRIENLALDKESRVIENRKKWETFTKELEVFETWIQKALLDYKIESCSDADIEKLVILLQKHKELISHIRAQKKIILTLNLTGQKFLNVSCDNLMITSLKQRIKTVNDHWDNLYSTALLWQSKLQSEFVQSSEFRSTIEEMKLWLKESEKRIEEMSQVTQKDERILHEQHTELFALKQQLEVYCNRIETLLEITLHLFLPEFHSDEYPSLPEESLTQLQTELKSNLKMSQSLLIKCTEMLKNVSSLLGFSKFREHISQSRNEATAVSQIDSRSSNRSECCSFLMRVARASFPIQAILLLLLGAAILLPMEEEEELSCRLSNNFAASLNPMLRYPDGPPPV